MDATDDALDGDIVARGLKALVEKEKPDLVLLGKQQVDGNLTLTQDGTKTPADKWTR